MDWLSWFIAANLLLGKQSFDAGLCGGATVCVLLVCMLVCMAMDSWDMHTVKGWQHIRITTIMDMVQIYGTFNNRKCIIPLWSGYVCRTCTYMARAGGTCDIIHAVPHYNGRLTPGAIPHCACKWETTPSIWAEVMVKYPCDTCCAVGSCCPNCFYHNVHGPVCLYIYHLRGAGTMTLFLIMYCSIQIIGPVWYHFGMMIANRDGMACIACVAGAVKHSNTFPCCWLFICFLLETSCDGCLLCGVFTHTTDEA